MPRWKIIRLRDAQLNLSRLTVLKTFCPDRKTLPVGDLGGLCYSLDVEVLDVERVVFDEFATGFDVFAHQGGEDGLSFSDIFELD